MPAKVVLELIGLSRSLAGVPYMYVNLWSGQGGSGWELVTPCARSAVADIFKLVPIRIKSPRAQGPLSCAAVHPSVFPARVHRLQKL